MRKNNGKFENRLNYTEIVCMGIKTKDHSDFMNELNLRMILWSTAEAVLRQLSLGIYIIILILWSTAEAVMRQTCFIDRCLDCVDPLVYCGSGTETIIML